MRKLKHREMVVILLFCLLMDVALSSPLTVTGIPLSDTAPQSSIHLSPLSSSPATPSHAATSVASSSSSATSSHAATSVASSSSLEPGLSEPPTFVAEGDPSSFVPQTPSSPTSMSSPHMHPSSMYPTTSHPTSPNMLMTSTSQPPSSTTSISPDIPEATSPITQMSSDILQTPLAITSMPSTSDPASPSTLVSPGTLQTDSPSTLESLDTTSQSPSSFTVMPLDELQTPSPSTLDFLDTSQSPSSLTMMPSDTTGHPSSSNLETLDASQFPSSFTLTSSDTLQTPSPSTLESLDISQSPSFTLTSSDKMLTHSPTTLESLDANQSPSFTLTSSDTLQTPLPTTLDSLDISQSPSLSNLTSSDISQPRSLPNLESLDTSQSPPSFTLMSSDNLQTPLPSTLDSLDASQSPSSFTLTSSDNLQTSLPSTLESLDTSHSPSSFTLTSSVTSQTPSSPALDSLDASQSPSSFTLTSTDTLDSLTVSQSPSSFTLMPSTTPQPPLPSTPISLPAPDAFSKRRSEDIKSQSLGKDLSLNSQQQEVPTTLKPAAPSSLEPETLQLSSPSPSKEEFYNLTKEYFQWKLKEFPQQASSIGINGLNAARLDKLSPEQFEQRRLDCEGFLERAQNVTTTGFSKDDLLNYRIFLEELNTYLRNFKYRKFYAPINFLGGPQNRLKRTIKKNTVLKTYHDYLKLIARCSEFPRQAEEMINLMRGNMVNGLMPSNWSLIGVTEQIDSLLVPFNESVFYEHFLDIKLNISDEQKESLRRQAEKPVKNLLSAFKKIRDFIETEYFPNARSSEGVSSLPGGADYYQACLNFHTTTELTPQEIHNLGLNEVARIQKEVAQTAIELGLANKTLAEISSILQEDPNQRFNSKEDLLNTYRDAVYNTIYPLMGQIVNHVPESNVSVEENISGATYASYSSPPLDGSRPGTFYINAKIYKHLKRYEVIALSLHEAVPGHHLQRITLLNNPSMPDFRKFPDFYRYEDIPARFPMHTVFSEGWGLYSEYLGNELGLYQDPYQRLGRHSFELLRASRLVVDTGLHALGWTRQQAIDYLLENSAMSEAAIKIQIDRYITWPGQACAYKVGEIKIRQLRQKTEEALGNRFHLQDFHDMVLGCVGPLNILEECVNDYIMSVAPPEVLQE